MTDPQKDNNENKNDDDKSSMNNDFKRAARVMSYVSAITGGPLVSVFCMYMYSQTDSKLWIVGAVAGFASAFLAIYQAAKASSDGYEQPKDLPPPNDWDDDDDDWSAGQKDEKDDDKGGPAPPAP